MDNPSRPTPLAYNHSDAPAQHVEPEAAEGMCSLSAISLSGTLNMSHPHDHERDLLLSTHGPQQWAMNPIRHKDTTFQISAC